VVVLVLADDCDLYPGRSKESAGACVKIGGYINRV
jgi:hypothetical protein